MSACPLARVLALPASRQSAEVVASAACEEDEDGDVPGC